MFLGHFGLAFAAKRVAPRTGLGAMGAATQWVDLVWPVLVLAGVERVRIAPGDTAWTPLAFEHYPWTHSLLFSLAWAAAAGLAWLAATRDRRGSAVIAALVASHWFLDFLCHRPDLALTPWSDVRLGLGLWNFPAATVAVEGTIFGAGVALYAMGTRPVRRGGSAVLWSLVVFLVVAAVANQLSVPPDGTAVAVGGLSMWLLVAWMAWVDRLRQPREGASAPVAAGSPP
jgi:membrane-bound metal-dependent hydrolase YbcI (DUF457 family)